MINRTEYLAIAFRVNAAMSYAAQGESVKAHEQYVALLTFMKTLTPRA